MEEEIILENNIDSNIMDVNEGEVEFTLHQDVTLQTEEVITIVKENEQEVVPEQPEEFVQQEVVPEQPEEVAPEQPEEVLQQEVVAPEQHEQQEEVAQKELDHQQQEQIAQEESYAETKQEIVENQKEEKKTNPIKINYFEDNPLKAAICPALNVKQERSFCNIQ